MIMRQEKNHEGKRPATVTFCLYHQESETIASSDPGPLVVPAVPDLQQEQESVLDSNRESQNECPQFLYRVTTLIKSIFR